MRTGWRKRTSVTVSWLCCVLLVIGVALPAAANAQESGTLAGARDLKAVEVTHNTVTLDWISAAGVKDYWVWTADGNKYVNWVNEDMRVVGGLEPNTTYSFFIGPDGIQVGNLTEEQKSNVVTFTTLEDTSEYPDPPLTPPGYLRVTDVTYGAVTLNWSSSPGATGYDLYVNGAWKGGTWSNEDTEITYEPEEGFVEGTTYIFEVGAQNPPHPVSANSNKVQLVWGELASPQDLQAVTTTRTAAVLGWAAVPGATGYEVYQDGKLIGTTDTNHYEVKGLTEGKSYTFAAAAVNPQVKSALSAPAVTTPGSDYTLVTYYISWAASEEARNYKPADMDVSQVTHINYAFADLCWKGYGTGAVQCQNEDIPLQADYVFDGEIVVGDQELDVDHFRQLAEIRAQNPHLKILASVGGWSWSKNFSNMAASEETRRAFANSVVKFIREYELDGIDIDWEYPVEGGEEHNSRRAEDRENFPLMTRTVREALDAAGSEDGKYYLQTIASGQGDNFVVNADLAQSSADLDFINIMTYDYSGSWEELAHHNAPLYYDPAHPRENAKRNHVSGGIQGHLNGGVPHNKLVVGVPFYGKGWQDCPAAGDGQYQTCSGGTNFGSWENGIFDYTDLENNYVNKNGYVRHWNEASKVAYLYNSDKQIFISYNDKATMMYTASLIKSLDVAGAMNWEITGDRNKTLMTQLHHDLPINGERSLDELPAPKELQLAASGEHYLDLKWEAVTGASGYEVFLNDQWMGYTTETAHSLKDLQSSTKYKVHVLAVKRTKDDIQAVSAASSALEAATQAPYFVMPGITGGTGSQPLAKGELGTAVNDRKEAVIVGDAAVETIAKGDENSFFVTLPQSAQYVMIPRQVVEALRAKGPQTELRVLAGQAELVLPAAAWKLSSDVRVAVHPVAEDAQAELQQAAEQRRFKLAGTPIAFELEVPGQDGQWRQLQENADRYVSRFIILDPEGLDAGRLAGVVYDPAAKKLYPVPARFTVNKDGTVRAELKSKSGSGIFAVAETNVQVANEQKAWARSDIAEAAAKLLLDLDRDGRFEGSRVITRAELAAMLTRALGIVPAASQSFADVTAQARYAGEIEAARQSGLVKGKSAARFDPNGSVTRQEMAVMLSNALAYAGQQAAAGDQVLQAYADEKTIAGFARTAMSQMADAGIMLGASASRLAPRSDVTQAEAVVAMMRMLRSAALTQ